MLSFGLTFARLLKGVALSWANPDFKATLLLAIIIVLSGASFYHSFEGWSWVDSIYFSVMTAATIGFGDLSPTTPISRIFTTFYAIISIGVFVALITHIATSLIKTPAEKVRKGNSEK